MLQLKVLRFILVLRGMLLDSHPENWTTSELCCLFQTSEKMAEILNSNMFIPIPNHFIILYPYVSFNAKWSLQLILRC
jgi:hypothetical protein